MARNEEKQLARLNRFYLQQQKDEELKKRPPRPRLEMLSTVCDVKKWLPSIMKDIDFYVMQMEVPCYPKRQIEEFERKISHLRGEYKAFVRKIHQLEPDLDVTPWSDRPYTGKKKKTEENNTDRNRGPSPTDSLKFSEDKSRLREDNGLSEKFLPIATPVLKNDMFYQHCYGFEKTPEVPENIIDSQLQDEPLQFNFSQKSLEYPKKDSSEVVDSPKAQTDAVLLFNWNANDVSVNIKDCKSINLRDEHKSSKDSMHLQNQRSQDNESESKIDYGQSQTKTLTQHPNETSSSCTKNPEVCSFISDILLSEKHEAPKVQNSVANDFTDGEQKTNRNHVPLESVSQDITNSGGEQDVRSQPFPLLHIPYSDSSSSDEET